MFAEHWRAVEYDREPLTNSAMNFVSMRFPCHAHGVYFETGGFTFADERQNRHHLRLGYSVIKRSRIAEGIGKIAAAVPHAVPDPGPDAPAG